ncbi:hypothetical protein RS130_12600 [Paraglaciecola aquimarina]|uniref:Uncharacterized protein n=1 Tax=Paraglaciecola aquimarina TaxID=1235557 RepID=A0ABU3SX96_9ALTE|nr:hypothetical protein [Paraglaciecola aquimarina]MDU0354643.1 hypothetical protein [Paraglaciecola aquimarina]
MKPYGLTITAGVQINSTSEPLSFSIVNVQLNHDSNSTEVDLLSPAFAEKFACAEECQNLGLYDSAFKNEQTQLTSFFYAEEGRFFEFYGRLTRLNTALADYRASVPEILEKYLTLLLNRQLKFNSLAAFIDHLEQNITEEKLLAFSKSGFISPVSNSLSPTYKQDLIASLSDYLTTDLQVVESDFLTDSKSPGGNWNRGKSINPDNNWIKTDSMEESNNWIKTNSIEESKNWIKTNSIEESKNWDTNMPTPDERVGKQLGTVASTGLTMLENWQQAKLKSIYLGALVCSYSDNTFGLVKKIGTERIQIDVIAQARVLIDGLSLYPQPGYLFSQTRPFYFVKTVQNDSYAISDIAPCNFQNITTS